LTHSHSHDAHTHIHTHFNAGNGVYAQSQVRLLSNQPDVQVLVVSGKPCGHSGRSEARGAQLVVEVRWLIKI
jgi:polysaccharide pyruvyl transferase WcaK-like protein